MVFVITVTFTIFVIKKTSDSNTGIVWNSTCSLESGPAKSIQFLIRNNLNIYMLTADDTSYTRGQH